MVLLGPRECVPAGAVGDEEQVRAIGRMGRRLDRCATRHADRTRRQPGVAIGVVRGIGIQLRPGQAVVEHAGTVAGTIDHRRVRLQLHAAAQPIDVDGRDQLAFLRLGGLALDDARQDDGVARRSQRQIRRARRPGGGHIGLHRPRRPAEQDDPRRAAVIDISVRQHATLGDGWNVALERPGFGQQRGHLGGRQTFGHGQFVLDRLAVAQHGQNLVQTGAGRKLELGRFKRAGPARGQRRGLELPAMAHHALILQHIRHNADTAARDDDGLTARQRTWGIIDVDGVKSGTRARDEPRRPPVKGEGASAPALMPPA